MVGGAAGLETTIVGDVLVLVAGNPDVLLLLAIFAAGLTISYTLIQIWAALRGKRD